MPITVEPSTTKAAADTLTINEIFYSIQGESSFAGQPCVFVRLTGCDLRCTYCDTEYAFYEGKRRSLDDIMAEVATHPCKLVEVTGIVRGPPVTTICMSRPASIVSQAKYE